MTHQLKQAALTFATRRSLWLVAALLALVVVPMQWIGLFTHDDRLEVAQAALLGVGFQSIILAFVLATHAKWQFCDARAWLTPGYAPAHIGVLWALILPNLAVIPVASALACGWNPLGLAACAAALAAVYIWVTHAPTCGAVGATLALTLSLVGVAMALTMSLVPPAGVDFWALPESAARFAPAHWAILLVGWTSLTAWLWRLPRIREEDRDFGISPFAELGSNARPRRTQSSRVTAHRMRVWRKALIPGDRWRDRLADIRPGAVRQRQALLDYGFGLIPTALSGVLMAVAIVGFMAAIVAMVDLLLFARDAALDQVRSLITMLIAAPALVTAGTFASRRPQLAQELMLPLTRREYFQGLFVAAVSREAIVWSITFAALVGILWWAAPAALTATLALGLAALSLSGQYVIFVVMLWAARFKSGGVRFVVSVVVYLAVVAVITLGAGALFEPQNAQRAASIVVLLTVAGLGMTAFTRRQWLNMELG